MGFSKRRDPKETFRKQFMSQFPYYVCNWLEHFAINAAVNQTTVFRLVRFKKEGIIETEGVAGGGTGPTEIR